MTNNDWQPKRPPIILIDSEADILTDLALAMESRAPMLSKMLLEEIERAETCERERVPNDVITMKSFVEFVDERAGTSREVQLVYPGDADAGAARISILTPIGAALIGLRVGQSISWPNLVGEHRLLRIGKVSQPAEDT